MKNKLPTRHCNTIDLTRMPYTTYGVGIDKANPRKCIKCHQPIRKGEAWQRHTSPADPEFGRYSFVVHSWCSQPIPRLPRHSRKSQARQGKSK